MEEREFIVYFESNDLKSACALAFFGWNGVA